jgi:hypothetical protein
MRSLPSLEIELNGTVSKEYRMGYYDAIEDAETFVFGLEVASADGERESLIPFAANANYAHDDTETFMDAYEDLLIGDEIMVVGYPTIIDGELFIRPIKYPEY